MLTMLTEVAIRPPLEMTWPSLDQVKLVGDGLASNTKEWMKSSVSNTVVGWFGRMLYAGGSVMETVTVHPHYCTA